jgi:hypothetical protein
MTAYLRFDTVKARGKTAYKPTNEAAQTIVSFTTKKTFNDEQLQKLREAGHIVLLDGAPEPLADPQITPQSAVSDAINAMAPSDADNPQRKLERINASGKPLTNRQKKYLKHKLQSDRELVI